MSQPARPAWLARRRLTDSANLIALALVLSVFVIVGYIIRDLTEISNDTRRLGDVLTSGLDLINRLQYQTQETRRTMLYALGTSDANEQVSFAQQSRAASQQVEVLLGRKGALTDVPDSAEALDDLRAAWIRYLSIRDEVVGLVLEGELALGVALDLNDGAHAFADIELRLDLLAEEFQRHAAVATAGVSRTAQSALRRMAALASLAVLAIGSAVYLSVRRRATNRSLHEQSSRNALLEAIVDTVMSIDEDDRVVEANAGAAIMFGIPQDVLRGRSIGTLCDVPGILGALTRGLTDELCRRSSESDNKLTEAVGRRAGGARFPIEMRVVAHTVLGRRRFIAHLRDISERRRAEDALREATRTAEAAMHAKSEFVAAMSHEIRTPLNALIGMTSLLSDSSLTREQREWVAAGRSSSEALLAVINNVLDFSRIEEGHLSLDPQPIDVRALVDESLDVVALAASRKRLALRREIDAQVPRAVVVDRTRVSQVLLNLLSNAVKFTQEGSVTLALRSRPFTDGRGDLELCFEVIDTGIGIPVDRMPRLFHAFSQGDVSTTRRYGGSGLGLAISRRLADALGGTLTPAAWLARDRYSHSRAVCIPW